MRLTLRQQLAEFLWRRQGNLTLEQFARRLGIPAATLCRLRAGRTNFSVDTLEQICRALHCTLAEIFPAEYAPVARPLQVANVTRATGPIPIENASLAERRA